jgi:hypothetical protein
MWSTEGSADGREPPSGGSESPDVDIFERAAGVGGGEPGHGAALGRALGAPESGASAAADSRGRCPKGAIGCAFREKTC